MNNATVRVEFYLGGKPFIGKIFSWGTGQLLCSYTNIDGKASSLTWTSTVEGKFIVQIEENYNTPPLTKEQSRLNRIKKILEEE